MSVATLSRFETPDIGALRRAGAYAVAAALHVTALILLLISPPAVLEPARRAIQAVEVRLYTVAGGADAESDAPLYEPPIAEAPEPTTGDGAAPAPVVSNPPNLEAEASEPEPAEAPAEVEQAPAEAESLAPEADEPVEPTPDAGAGPDGATPRAPNAAGAAQTPAPAAPTDPAEPLSTTQVEVPERRARSAAPPPSFADILARAESRLDPDDFRVAEMAGGVRGATRESFCLSSASGNRDAMDCPDGPNLASVELAQYGLRGLGEEAPEFMEDLSRLEFQLRTLGADDNAVSRILLALRESRREAINTSPIIRQMERDREPGSP